MSSALPALGAALKTIHASAKTEYDKQKSRAVKATQDFEAVFLGMMLKQMHKSMAGDNALFGKSPEAKVYQDMMDDTLATTLSRSGSFGLGKAMMKSLSHNLPPDPDQPAALPRTRKV